jgi:hypothetical protein
MKNQFTKMIVLVSLCKTTAKIDFEATLIPKLCTR